MKILPIRGYEFKVGDKVWIERTEFVENVQMIREPQIIECIDYSEVVEHGVHKLSQIITIKGSRFLYDEDDIKIAK